MLIQASLPEPLWAEEETEQVQDAQFEPTEEAQKMSAETQNWIFAIGAAIAAAIGITVVSLSNGQTAHH